MLAQLMTQWVRGRAVDAGYLMMTHGPESVATCEYTTLLFRPLTLEGGATFLLVELA